MSGPEVKFDLPDCVKIATQKDDADFKVFVDSVVKAATKHAATVLKNMLASESPGAQELAREFASRLGV